MILKVAGPDRRMILVLDEHTAKVISSCLRANEIVDAGIIAMEALHVKREPMPEFPAIYFIDPSEQSVTYMINDFEDKQRPQYQAAYVFFTRTVPDSVRFLNYPISLTFRLFHSFPLCPLSLPSYSINMVNSTFIISL